MNMTTGHGRTSTVFVASFSFCIGRSYGTWLLCGLVL